MSYQPHPKALPAAFMLVLFLAVSFLGAEGTLLCFGKDGHVAVELVDSCSGSGLGSQLAGGDSDGCGPCKDIQFLGDPACINHASYDTQTLPPASVPLMFPVLPSRENVVKQADQPDFSHQDSTLTSLQTVVLLI